MKKVGDSKSQFYDRLWGKLVYSMVNRLKHLLENNDLGKLNLSFSECNLYSTRQRINHIGPEILGFSNGFFGCKKML